jgi:hypothetical protein
VPHRIASTIGDLAVAPYKLARMALSAWWSSESQPRGVCATCGEAVIAGDPFLRYGGAYFHADGCVESCPPAEHDRLAAARMTA